MSVKAAIKKLYFRVKTVFLEQLGVPVVDFISFRFNKRAGQDKLVCLIVKPDAIGDYVLFRSFIKSLRTEKSPVKNHKLVLLGNVQYKGLYEALDIDCFDEVIWVNRLAFCRNLKYRFHFINHLKSRLIDTWIYPVHHRDFHFDRLLKYLKPNRAYTMAGGFGNSSKQTLEKYNKYYTDLIEIAPEVIHELDKYRLFFGQLTKFRFDSVDCISPPDLNSITNPITCKDYFVVFPGASVKTKQWPVDRFIKLANYIQEIKGWKVVVAGGPSENEICEAVFNGIHGEAINLSGKTSLIELWKLIAESSFLLANDTVAIHLAAMFGIKVVCPFNGIHFGAFVPWPRGQGKPVYAVLPHGFDPLMYNYQKGEQFPFSIDDVRLEDAIKEVNNAIQPVD